MVFTVRKGISSAIMIISSYDYRKSGLKELIVFLITDVLGYVQYGFQPNVKQIFNIINLSPLSNVNHSLLRI